jgi:hypothetical protein
MGTRSLTFVYDQYGEVQKPVCNMYRQFDGYPSGHGAELAEFLNKCDSYNGMGCLAAQMIHNFKTESYNVYLYPTDVTNCGQDYEYHISQKKDGLYVEVFNCGCNMFGLTMSDTHELVFQGNLSEFTQFCSSEELV